MLAAITLFAQLATAVPTDTPTTPAAQRVRAVEVSEWYSRRLTLHRRLSYTVIPLFAFQYAAGSQIWTKGDAAPEWARRGHRIGAATIGGVFVANTVTGAWNLWDSRATTEGRTRRYLHATSMFLADAGLAWAGAKLSEEAERSFEKRRLHRTVALTSIGLTMASGLVMYFTND